MRSNRKPHGFKSKNRRDSLNFENTKSRRESFRHEQEHAEEAKHMRCDAWLHYDHDVVTRMVGELFPKALCNRHAVLYLDDELDSVRIFVTCVNIKLNPKSFFALVLQCTVCKQE